MITKKPTYRKSIKVIHWSFFSFYIYFMNPGGVEKKHFHDGVEIEYVFKGNCSTHKKGSFYFRKKGEIHEGINDSKGELVFLTITIPAETENNTHYV